MLSMSSNLIGAISLGLFIPSPSENKSPTFTGRVGDFLIAYYILGDIKIGRAHV